MAGPGTMGRVARLKGSSHSSWPAAGPAAAAADAVRLAERAAPEAAAAAAAALSRARIEADPAGISMAEHALGLAARECGDSSASAAHLRRAIAEAERGGLGECAAETRVSLMGTLAYRGDFAGALDQADLAVGVLRGADRARLCTQRASVLQCQGRLDDALDGFRRALPVLRRAKDSPWLAHLHNNRGLVHCLRGDLASAEVDLRRAASLYQQVGMDEMLTHTRQNLAVVAARRGDLPAALALFDAADVFFAERGDVDAVGLYDRCESLLAARLVEETRRTAGRAIEALEREGRWSYLAEARLMAAEAALLDGDAPAAREAAARARRAFSRQRRPTWVARARYLVLQARWLDGDCSVNMLAEARKSGDALSSAGFELAAADARLLAAQIALDRGRLDVARGELLLARSARRGEPVAMRSRAWQAEALLRLADGNRSGTYSALRAGVKMLDRYRATLGATELRAHASGHSVELAQLGIRLACEDGNAERVLVWAERWRAGALRLRPVRPPGDARLAADLTALRLVVAEVQQAAMTGQPIHRLRARQAYLAGVSGLSR